MVWLPVCIDRGAVGVLNVSMACFGPLRLVIVLKSVMLLLLKLYVLLKSVLFRLVLMIPLLVRCVCCGCAFDLPVMLCVSLNEGRLRLSFRKSIALSSRDLPILKVTDVRSQDGLRSFTEMCMYLLKAFVNLSLVLATIWPPNRVKVILMRVSVNEGVVGWTGVWSMASSNSGLEVFFFRYDTSVKPSVKSMVLLPKRQALDLADLLGVAGLALLDGESMPEGSGERTGEAARFRLGVPAWLLGSVVLGGDPVAVPRAAVGVWLGV